MTTLMPRVSVLAIIICLWFNLNLTKSLVHNQQNELQIAKQWQIISYNFPAQANVNDLNFYNPSNVLITGIAVSHDRIFIATPQLFSGVSSTVSFVPKSNFGDSPVVQAYPDWSFSVTGQKNISCDDLNLISVYRLRIDSCNRLWVLDAGVSRSLEDFENTCPPKILIIDLKSNQVVRRVDFPKEIIRGESLFTNLVVDETTSKEGTCDDVFVYITDTVEPAIVVYDSKRDVTWRLSHPAMYPDPDFAQSQILNDRFILMDGVVGLTFDEKSGNVYFQPLATDRIFSVSKNVLRAGPLPQNEILQVKLVGKKSSQGIGMTVSPIDSSLIFSPLSETAIASWNPVTNKQIVLAQDRDRLQFVADITTTKSEPGVIYGISSKFHRFFLKNLNANEVNNRVVRIELPGESIIPTHTNFPLNNRYNYRTTFGPSLSLYHSNALPSITSVSNYFSKATSNYPFNFEDSGIVNYAIKNPFAALNQGETFTSTKASQRSLKPSFLDSLAGEPIVVPILPSTLHTKIQPNIGYFYDRNKRESS